MTSRYLLAGAVLWSLLIGDGTAAHADFIRIPSPNAAYKRSTSKLPITEADFTKVPFLSDAFLKVTFSNPLEARTVPNSWGTWSSPPDNAESATPRVLYTGTTTDTVTLTFSRPVRTFGVEVEPGRLGRFMITGTFFDARGQVGAIPITVNGFAGARLFAATTTTTRFTKVEFSGPRGVSINGLAIAQPRYAIPEPSSAVLLTLGILAGFAGSRYCRRVRRSVH
jgi:hypothetical protein